MTVQVAQDDPELVAERFALSRERRTRRKSAMKEHDGLAGDLVLEHGAVVKGALTRIVYTNPAGRSTLEIFRNHRGALDGAGAEILYTCEENACGPGYARSRWGQTNGLLAASDGDPRYVAARVTRGQAQAYVAVMVGKQRTQVAVVESRPWTKAS